MFQVQYRCRFCFVPFGWHDTRQKMHQNSRAGLWTCGDRVHDADRYRAPACTCALVPRNLFVPARVDVRLRVPVRDTFRVSALLFWSRSCSSRARSRVGERVGDRTLVLARTRRHFASLVLLTARGRVSVLLALIMILSHPSCLFVVLARCVTRVGVVPSAV